MSQFWPFPRIRSLGVVERNSFRFFPADQLARSNGTNGTEKNGMNSVLRRSHLGGARQLVCNHEQTGAVAPSENGRLPPVLAHQLAGARKSSQVSALGVGLP